MLITITQCKHNKNKKSTKEFLERNLRKVKFEEKGCIGMCSECKKEPIAVVNGKKISGKDDYELLKKLKKVCKLEETDLKIKEEKANKEKNDKKEIEKKSKVKVKARLLGDELYISLPKDVYEKDNLKINFISDEKEEEVISNLKKIIEEKLQKSK